MFVMYQIKRVLDKCDQNPGAKSKLYY